MSATPWLEADALFHRDPRWLGADDAYSVPLSPGRSVWLFGDTFVGDGALPARANARFVRNSVGVMDGDDPTTASMTYAWGDGGDDGMFEVPAPDWLWPLDGVRIDAGLLVFFMLVRPVEAGRTGGIDDWRALGPLGFFDVYGWTAARVTNPDDAPDAWRWSYVAPVAAAPIVLGASALIEGAHLLVYGWDAAHRVYLARFDLDGLTLDAPTWWAGDAWGGAPAPVMVDGSTEFTVHRRASDDYRLLTAGGVSPASLVRRTAPAPQGPWSAPVTLYTPPVPDGAFAYAGKAHPQLRGPGLVATYVTIASADQTLADDTLYYPRFVRIPEGP